MGERRAINDDDEDVFQTEWFRIGKYDYAVVVIPESLPRWVPQVGTGGGASGAIIAAIALSLHRKPPYVATIVRTKGHINFRWRRVYEAPFGHLDEAMARGRELEACLRGGSLPESSES